MKKKPKKYRCTPRTATFLASIKYATDILTTEKHSFSANRRSYVEARAWKSSGELRNVANDLKNIVRTEGKDFLSWRAKAEDEVVWTWKNYDLDAIQADLKATREKGELSKIAKKVRPKPNPEKPVRSKSI